MVRGNDWVNGIAQGLNTIQVSVQDISIEHSVKIQDFTAWLERTSGSPKQISKRSRIKEILGLRKIRAQSQFALMENTLETSPKGFGNTEEEAITHSN